ncbi:MAG: ATP-binding protein [Actinomycetota bacterium]|nr:ATP-binding protein [Actinomycetota bacterium]
MAAQTPNPFRYGALALDEAFTDRQDEIAELEADIRNGQDVVLFAPRRYGKSSLVWRVAQRLVKKRVLVAQVDLMTTPTKERLAEKLATTIYEDVASPLFRAKERLRVFQNLRIRPTVIVNPDDASLSFTFEAGRAVQDLDETLERLLELPGKLAAERDRQAVLILDEFQEIVDIDRDLPKLMRAVFQQQPEVAHVYLGSKRHMMQRIFSDENEPFWRSAKQMELGVIAPELFAGFIADQFEATARRIKPEAIQRLLAITRGHPYATQELAYFLWQATRPRPAADVARVEEALAAVLRSEHAHFSLVWGRASSAQRSLLHALARQPGHPLSAAYRRRFVLPGPSTVQKALEALERDELIAREGGFAEISEPFLGEWIVREVGG